MIMLTVMGKYTAILHSDRIVSRYCATFCNRDVVYSFTFKMLFLNLLIADDGVDLSLQFFFLSLALRER